LFSLQHLQNLNHIESKLQDSMYLVYDNAATPYSFYEGKNCVNYGVASFVSLHHTKPIGFGEGGLAIIDKKFEKYVRESINFGMDEEKNFTEFGSNCKMSEISAAAILQWWDQFDIDESNVFYPNRDAIGKVLAAIEQDRDEFEDFLIEQEIYERFKKETKNKNTIAQMEAENLNEYIRMGYVGENGYLNNKIKKPEWKYKDISGKIRPPTSLLVMDDVLGSTALSQSEAFTKLCIQNRHIAPLSQPFDDRQALGCSVIILSQVYSSQNGIPRACRENATDLILFKNRQKGAMEKIKQELAGAVEEDEFEQAYLYATEGKHDNLCISFNADCPTKRYRKNLNQFIIFPSAEKECKCKTKKDIKK